METIAPIADFKRTLAAERALAERTRRGFSLLVFDLGGYTDRVAGRQTLESVLRHRLRNLDEAGWLDNRRVGVLLRETPAGGARKPAADICAALCEKRVPDRCSIVSYPDAPETGASGQLTGRGAAVSVALPELTRLTAGRVPLWKRAMDITCGVAGLIVLLPVLLLIAAGIKLVSRGPVLFRQPRVGYLGRTFACWKFRTMRINADAATHHEHFSRLIHTDAPMHKLDERDSRIIPFGTVLRKTGLDELPQLFNVIRGEMSLVGPRPCIPYEAQQFQPWQLRRFCALPGITGLWQVSGKNRTTFTAMMRYDIAYASRVSLWRDLWILLKTPLAIYEQVVGTRTTLKDIEEGRL